MDILSFLFPTINSVYVALGAILLGFSGGMTGSFAVLRRQGLLSDTLAHASLPGIAIAFLIMKTKFLPGLLIGALLAGLLGALFIYLIISYSKIRIETAMASVLSAFFGWGIVMLTYIQNLPYASQSGLDSFLFGQAAALLLNDVYMMAVVVVLLLIMVMLFWKELKLFTFDAEFAHILGFNRKKLEFIYNFLFVSAVLISLQAVGVILTAALFITPAIAAYLLTHRLFVMVVLSSLFGMLAGLNGALFSAFFEDLPTGPVIVLTLSFIFLLALLFAPKRGLVSRMFLFFKYSRKIKYENFLANLYRDCESGVKRWGISTYVPYLKRRGLVKISGSEFCLTDKGKERAAEIVEKHRLWEAYLAYKVNIAPDHVHRDAEDMEHVLTDEMVAELRIILKDHGKDPHGKPFKSI